MDWSNLHAPPPSHPETIHNQDSCQELPDDVCETRNEMCVHNQLIELQMRNSRLQEENNRLTNECKTLEIELEEKKRILETKDEQCKTLEIELEEKKRILETKDEQMAEKQAEVFHYAKSLQIQGEDYEKEKQSIQKKFEVTSERLSTKEALCNSLLEERETHVASYEKLREDYNDHVKKTAKETACMVNKLENVQKELKESKKRLASVYQKRLLIDQRRVENTVEFNRPSDVERDFREFFEGDRIDALNSIEETISPMELSDLQACYLACIIFVTAYEEVEDAKETSRDLLNNLTRELILDTPRRSQELCQKRKESGPCSQLSVAFNISVSQEESEDPVDAVESLILSLKKTAHICDLECFENIVKKVVLERVTKCHQETTEMSLLPEPDLSAEVISKLDDYIKACIRLCWRLVTQLPPLQLEYSCRKFHKQMHRMKRSFYNLDSDDSNPSGDTICYLWPALLEQGGRVIFPAEVICIPASS